MLCLPLLLMNTFPFEVDLVFLWVDGDDPVWLEKKNRYSPTPKEEGQSEIDCKGRYSDNQELKFALRSAELHVPWIRRIFIVTDNQQPAWLNTEHPQITIVDHKDILPAEALPCYNATVIEHYLYKIPGLEEHFLFGNDDMFFNADFKPDFFFGQDGYPIVRLKRKYFGKWSYRMKKLIGKELGHYAHVIRVAAQLIEQKFGVYFSGVPHHNIDAYRKSDFREAVEVVFAKEVEIAKSNRLRAFSDLQRTAFSLYALSIGHAHLKYVGRSESSRILLYRHNFRKYMDKYHPKLFCINDNQRVQDHHRAQVEPMLTAYFPKKSAFEK